MNKKTIIALVILAAILAGGGFLLWQNSQAAMKDLNATLPEGVRVVKSLFGNEYRVVNKIDGYEFSVPSEWGGLEKITYSPSEENEKLVVTSINVIGIQGIGRSIGIDKFKVEKDVEFESSVRTIMQEYGLNEELQDANIGGIRILKTKNDVNLAKMETLFFQSSKSVYAITGGSEKFTKEIILNGKW